MTATYDATKLGEFGKDRMRFELGDTNMDEPILQDEEINIFVTEESSWKRAILKCTEKIASKFATEANMQIGPIKMDLMDRAKFWESKVANLKREQAGMAVPVAAASAGGEGDIQGAYFRVGLHDNREA
ncbi:hypothetical protein [Petroclostridium sp. X23]|uniref:hypothetical protein n=1 Tax=Petroclostridium sp. X23 TaxID=3045146 RepID=UPI0024AD56F5|nr:hypothetical protein [Petroclostridium sp. X23]WHH58305.1 hypothetical protein QKW49_21275 [Petroclostridium sp. X23]